MGYHIIPNSLFIRLSGITQAPAVNDMDVDHEPTDIHFPPTFNIQNEVIGFKVRTFPLG